MWKISVFTDFSCNTSNFMIDLYTLSAGGVSDGRGRERLLYGASILVLTIPRRRGHGKREAR